MNPLRFAVRFLGATAFCALVVTSIPHLTAGASPGSPAAQAKVLDLAADLDPTCKACDDFYQFATGGWIKNHPIPPGHASWGALAELSDQNRAVLTSILEDAAKNTGAPAGSDTQKLGSFYRACMDEAAIEKAGTAPIDPLLTEINGVTSTQALVGEIGKLHAVGVNGGLNFGSDADTKDSSKQIAALGLGGTGLPDRDYYLKDTERFAAIRKAYHGYVATQLVNLGETQAAADTDADNIIALETAIAKATPPREELRDPAATYHPTPVAQLASLAPHVAWTTYFAAYNAPKFDTVDVAVPSYVKGYDELLASTPLPTWKAYLRYKIADAYASALPKRFGDAQFAFRSTTLAGVKEQLPRSQRCTGATDASLRDVLGRAYVEKTFSPAAKARALALVNNLQSVLHDDMGQLDWMSAPTRVKAQEKLAAFTKKIGYPDKWVDFSSVTVTDSYANDVTAVRKFQTARNIARIGKPTDRGDFGMTPPTVNAYYNPSGNEIVFPAGILQPPFFNPNADDAVNYGAIGAVIGHEMTHGFDDQGRQFDGNGNLSNWWTPADAAAFKKRAQCIVDEYSSLEPLPGVHANGVNLQGEAIADLGGLTIAYKAFERTPQAKAHKAIDGYTPEQRFFLAFAQVWRGAQTEAAIRQAALTDPHPNPRLRVIGTLSNMPEFREAFHCAAGTPMVRKESCQIW
ncbi:MAG TPA: M13 family metallopeptidase [Candidatus Elarobacter sp.]|nr:M13 family metallopeptidase [Candidatus Elarobacter sp.]